MSEKINIRPAEFAAAYIQTLPHSRKTDEFENQEEYEKYMDERLEFYFANFVNAAFYADDQTDGPNEEAKND